MNDFEKQLLSNLEAISAREHPSANIAAYKDLQDAIRSRVDTEMMEYSFSQAKQQHAMAEQVAKSVAPSMQQSGGYAG